MRNFPNWLRNNFLPLSLCFIPFILYFAFFESIALNVNYIAYDDIDILRIVEHWQSTSLWSEKLKYLSAGFAEHRVVFARATMLLHFWISGGVSLKNLMIVSNFLWVAQIFVFYKIFALAKRPVFSSYSSSNLLYFVPFTWFFLAVLSFENIFWGVSSLCNFGVLFFTMIAGYFYTIPSNAHWRWAWIFSILATFSYGNGLASFLSGILVLLLTQRWRGLGETVGIFALTMLLYALTRTHASPISVDLGRWQSYPMMLTCFLGFVGSTVSIDAYQVGTGVMWASVIWGGVLLIFLGWGILSRLQLKNLSFRSSLSHEQLFLLYLIVFVSITAAGVVYKRAESDQLIGMFKGRYRMYPVWLLVAAYGWLLTTPWPRRRWFLPLTLAVSIGFNLLVLYFSIANAVNNRRMAVVQEFNSYHNPDLIGLKMFDLTGEDFRRLQNIYAPRLFYQDIDLKAISPTQVFPLDTAYFQGDILTINYTKDFVRPEKDYDDGAYAVLRSPTHTYMAAGLQHALPLKTFLRRGWYWERGFSAGYHRASIMPGQYELLILLRQNGQNHWYRTQYSFNIDLPTK